MPKLNVGVLLEKHGLMELAQVGMWTKGNTWLTCSSSSELLLQLELPWYDIMSICNSLCITAASVGVHVLDSIITGWEERNLTGTAAGRQEKAWAGGSKSIWILWTANAGTWRQVMSKIKIKNMEMYVNKYAVNGCHAVICKQYAGRCMQCAKIWKKQICLKQTWNLQLYQLICQKKCINMPLHGHKHAKHAKHEQKFAFFFTHCSGMCRATFHMPLHLYVLPTHYSGLCRRNGQVILVPLVPCRWNDAQSRRCFTLRWSFAFIFTWHERKENWKDTICLDKDTWGLPPQYVWPYENLILRSKPK